MASSPVHLLRFGGAHSLAGEGVGESQFGRGDRHCGTLGIYGMYFVCKMHNSEHNLLVGFYFSFC